MLGEMVAIQDELEFPMSFNTGWSRLSSACSRFLGGFWGGSSILATADIPESGFW